MGARDTDSGPSCTTNTLNHGAISLTRFWNFPVRLRLNHKTQHRKTALLRCWVHTCVWFMFIIVIYRSFIHVVRCLIQDLNWPPYLSYPLLWSSSAFSIIVHLYAFDLGISITEVFLIWVTEEPLETYFFFISSAAVLWFMHLLGQVYFLLFTVCFIWVYVCV